MVGRGTWWAGLHGGQGYTVGRVTRWAGLHGGQDYTVGRFTRWAGLHGGQGYMVAYYTRLYHLQRCSVQAYQLGIGDQRMIINA